MKLRHALLSCIALVACPGAVSAATSTNSLSISATVVASCNIANINSLAFGSLSVGALPANSSSTFTVKCTNTTSYTIGLNEGATPEQRRRRAKW